MNDMNWNKRTIAGIFAFGVMALLVLPLMMPSVMFAAAQDDDNDEIRRVLPESQTAVLLSYAPLVEKVAPAVVNIYTRTVVQIQRSPLFNDPFFRRFFGDDSPFNIPRERIQNSLGRSNCR